MFHPTQTRDNTRNLLQIVNLPTRFKDELTPPKDYPQLIFTTSTRRANRSPPQEEEINHRPKIGTGQNLQDRKNENPHRTFSGPLSESSLNPNEVIESRSEARKKIWFLEGSEIRKVCIIKRVGSQRVCEGRYAQSKTHCNPLKV